MNQSMKTTNWHNRVGEFLIIGSLAAILTASVYLHRLHPDDPKYFFGYSSLFVIFCLFSVASLPLVLAQPFRTILQRIVATCVSGVGLTFIWIFVFGLYAFLYHLGHPTPD